MSDQAAHFVLSWICGEFFDLRAGWLFFRIVFPMCLFDYFQDFLCCFQCFDLAAFFQNPVPFQILSGIILQTILRSLDLSAFFVEMRKIFIGYFDSVNLVHGFHAVGLLSVTEVLMILLLVKVSAKNLPVETLCLVLKGRVCPSMMISRKFRPLFGESPLTLSHY